MKFVSFFAGIGGIDRGLENAGHECAGQSEIDPDAIKVLQDHWPSVPQLGDVKEIDPNEIPEAKLWTAGFPCTDISAAGNQEGIHGSKSGLFFDWMRSVRVVRPQKLLMENVAALLHRGMGEVCGELATSGYDAEWDCIPAAAVGAPHLRDRIFIVADADAQGQPQPKRGVQDERRRSGDGDKKEDRKQRVFSEGPAIEFDGDHHTSLGTDIGCTWAPEPRKDWLDDGLPLGMAEVSSRLFGNAVVVKVAEYIGKLLPL